VSILAENVGSRSEFVGVTAIQDHFSAMLGETASNGKTETSVRSGNEDATVGKIKEVHEQFYVIGFKF
jgi:hypothetical protein